jgi:ParB-like chromosome segregation protein Spo0J
MAVVWNEASDVVRTANGGYAAYPENIILKPEFNGRSEDTDVTELAEDILHNNQIVAAICYKSKEGWPILLAGHRRLRAIRLLNDQHPDEKRRIVFNYASTSDGRPVQTEEQALDITVSENRNRTDINPLDDAYNIGIYQVKFGKSLEEIAQKYFPGAGSSPEKLAKAVLWVKERQKLLELTAEAQEKLRKGEFSTSAAKELAKLQPVDQTKLLAEKAAAGEKLKVGDAKSASPTKAKREIKDNSPVALLKRFKVAMEVSGSLATEIMAKRFERTADKEVIRELADQVLVMCKNLGVPLEASADTWAEDHKKDETVLTNLK